MGPAEAALIGAGVSAVVALSSQFLADRLATRRERRQLYRTQAAEIIEFASLALFGPTQEERDAFEPRELVPGSIGAYMPELLEPESALFNEAWSRALVRLQIHFGDDHPLVESYADTYVVVSRGVRMLLRSGRQDEPDPEDDAEVNSFPKILREAQLARLKWTSEGREVLARL